MNAHKFAVTYSIVTPESAEDGDAEEYGACDWINPFSLRDALDALHSTRTSKCDGVVAIEPDSAPCDKPRAVTVFNGMEFETGAHESRTLHIPDTVTRASARRIARAAGVRASFLTQE
jgi:hypothetical protein